MEGETLAARPVLEIGWILDTRLEEVDRRATHAAIDALEAEVREQLPAFDWRMPRTEREIVQAPVEEPVRLLDAGATDLSIHHWDFALVVTASDLRSHYRPSAVAAFSRALGVAVLSTFRIDPHARRQAAGADERRETIRRRLVRLASYVLGRLGGLPPVEDASSRMRPPDDEEELDRPTVFDDAQRAQLAGELLRVADERVEEERGAERQGWLRFYARAALRNRREIRDTVASSRWWELPFRMGRLTTAAVSALAIFLVTAEAWEIGHQLGVGLNALLSAFAVGATSFYLLQHQRLLVLPRTARRTEQAVVTRVTVVATVVLGMLVTYALLLALALGLEALVFRPPLVARWTGAEGGVGALTYLLQGTFTSDRKSVV